MYVVVELGGKQYRVAPGEWVDVDRLPEDVGQHITLDRVLMTADGDQITIGRPTVAGASITATVVSQGRRRKVTFFHYVPKKRERKKRGERQYYTRLLIEKTVA